MHAPGLKRTMLNRYLGVALVLGLAASLTANVVMFTRSNDGGAQPAAAQIRSITPAQQNSSAATTSQIDVYQMLAHQSAARPAQPLSSASSTGQIDVLQLRAEQRFAPTARDRFFLEPEP